MNTSSVFTFSCSIILYKINFHGAREEDRRNRMKQLMNRTNRSIYLFHCIVGQSTMPIVHNTCRLTVQPFVNRRVDDGTISSKKSLGRNRRPDEPEPSAHQHRFIKKRCQQTYETFVGSWRPLIFDS